MQASAVQSLIALGSTISSQLSVYSDNISSS
jgi:hypothetical protein